MTLDNARVKAREYADALAFKSLINKYFKGYTVTPTCNFSDNYPVEEKWDVTMTDDNETETIVELKSRSKKYRYFGTHFKDFLVNKSKVDNIRTESEKKGCKAIIAGIYPYDGVILIWDAAGEYEETRIPTKKFQYGADSDKVEEDKYLLPFASADKYYIEMKDFDENYQKAYNKYKKAVTDDAEGV